MKNTNMISRAGTILMSFLLLLTALPVNAKAWEVPPEKVLEQTSDKMFDTIREQKDVIHKEPQVLMDIIENVLGPQVDFPLVSRLVLGKYWRRATPEQRERFTEEFRKLLVRFYTSALVDDPEQIDELLAEGDKLITFRPSNAAPDAVKALVRSDVHLPSGQDVPVTFNVHHKGDSWKIYDVNVEGISLITNYRSSFSTEIGRTGIDALIDKLAARNKELLKKNSLGDNPRSDVDRPAG